MAQMYPNRLSPETQSFAEEQLYAAFRDELDDSYTVFHGVAWQSLDADGRPRDGEADFIIAHPQRGILVMEVKGGDIHYDPSEGQWSSIGAGKKIHSIKDPFAQARHSKYVLEDQLQRRLGWEDRRPISRRPLASLGRLPEQMAVDRGPRPNLGHAVAFPHVFVNAVWLGPDRPREIVLDMTDLTDLPRWVNTTLAYWRGKESQRNTAPGEKAVNALMSLLGKAWELRPALWGKFLQEREKLIRLTEQQYLVLDVLNQQRRAAISGCAGSGKTLLAAEKASRLAQQGFRVLLTCFNKNLAIYLRLRLKPSPNLEVIHFHGLCSDLAERAHIRPVFRDKKEYVNQLLPQALMDAADRLNVRYDAIVVDEGQDFRENYWIPLQTLLHDPDDGILYIFFDDNQRIYGQRSPFPIQQPPYSLTVNCRNTQSIHRQVLKFYNGDPAPIALGPVGRPVEVVEFDGVSGLRATLSSLIDRLTGKQEIPTDKIFILTPLTHEKSHLWNKPLDGKISLTDARPLGPNQVFCSTIHSFKGLEGAVVILAEMDRWPTELGDLEYLLYVACSRARNHLIVLLPTNAPPKIRKLFAQG